MSHTICSLLKIPVLSYKGCLFFFALFLISDHHETSYSWDETGGGAGKRTKISHPSPQAMTSWDIDGGLAADFDGSLSGLGTELGTSSYNMRWVDVWRQWFFVYTCIVQVSNHVTHDPEFRTTSYKMRWVDRDVSCVLCMYCTGQQPYNTQSRV